MRGWGDGGLSCRCSRARSNSRNLTGKSVRGFRLWPLRRRCRRRRLTFANALGRCAWLTTMKLLYPASHDIPRLSQELLALKIARHSRCSSCSSCSGLRPPPDVEVALDSEIQPESPSSASQEHSAPGPYLQLCSCGHDVLAHGADPSSIGVEEFARRSRVAVRLDELLEVSSCYMDGLPR